MKKCEKSTFSPVKSREFRKLDAYQKTTLLLVYYTLYCTVAAAYVGTGGALNFARGYGPKAGRKPPSGREPIPFPDFAAASATTEFTFECRGRNSALREFLKAAHCEVSIVQEERKRRVLFEPTRSILDKPNEAVQWQRPIHEADDAFYLQLQTRPFSLLLPQRISSLCVLQHLSRGPARIERKAEG